MTRMLYKIKKKFRGYESNFVLYLYGEVSLQIKIWVLTWRGEKTPWRWIFHKIDHTRHTPWCFILFSPTTFVIPQY